MEALVTIRELADRLSFVMSDDEEREATGALEDLSDDARFYGSSSWATADVAPRQVKNLIIRAARRHMSNFEGFVQSRAGDEALTWTDRGENAGSAYFTEREQRVLAQLAGRSGFGTMEQTAWGTTQHYHIGMRGSYYERPRPMPYPVEGLVSDAGSNEPIQMFECDVEPW